MYHFNIILTELCNANCSHCYMAKDTFTKKKSLSFSEIDLLIDRLPKETVSITLTGGEVFLVNDLLEYTIKKIKKKNANILIEVESNGIYLYNHDTKKILSHLKEIGVDSIRFSLDPFHQDGGVDLEKVKHLKDFEDKDTPLIRFLVQEKALALGNGKNLTADKIAVMNCMNSKKSLKEPYFFLDILGNVYICAWKCIPALGNIFKDDFTDILKKLKTPLFKNILCGNIKKAINLVNNKKENSQIIEEHGECYLCEKIFKENNHA